MAKAIPTEWLNDNELVTRIEERSGVRLSRGTPGVWRHRRQGPPFFRVNGAVRYCAVEVDAWLEAQRVEPRPGPIAASATQPEASPRGLTGAVGPS